jgi:hypothetical protein
LRSARPGSIPASGFFTEGRVSLAYDAIEAVRPYIEAWLLCVLAECRFAKRDFWEEPDGTIRLTRPLTSWLALSAPLWRRAAEVVARWPADAFEAMARHPGEARIEDDMIEAAELGAALPAPRKAVESLVVPRVPRLRQARASPAAPNGPPSPRPVPAHTLAQLPTCGQTVGTQANSCLRSIVHVFVCIGAATTSASL